MVILIIKIVERQGDTIQKSKIPVQIANEKSVTYFLKEIYCTIYL